MDTVVVNEEWRSAATLSLSMYMISSLGRVKNATTGRISARKPNAGGYYQFSLRSDSGKLTMHYVHRLVAVLFLPRSLGKNVVNHKNHIRNDNRVDNLEWTTQSENVRHANAKSTRAKKVKRIKADGDMDIWPSAVAASTATGLSLSTVKRRLNRKRPANNDFDTWTYVDTEYVPPDDTEEIWKPFTVKSAAIRVSSLGRVELPSGHKTIGKLNAYNYLEVTVAKQKIRVHTLVCAAFLGPRPDGFTSVDHINQDPLDNRLVNLRYATSQQQANNRKTVKPVQQIRSDGTVVATFTTMKEASDVTGVGHSTIVGCCNGRFLTAGGFTWKKDFGLEQLCNE